MAVNKIEERRIGSVHSIQIISKVPSIMNQTFIHHCMGKKCTGSHIDPLALMNEGAISEWYDILQIIP
jgi:hypothetical protein